MGSSASSSVSTLAETKVALDKLVSSYKAHGATSALLPAISTAMISLRVPMHCRNYRRKFSENYIMLLADETYRPEILNMAMAQESQVLVNGQIYQIAASTMGKGLVLKNCFEEVCNLLGSSSPRRFPSNRLRPALVAFESIWVQFEEAYISELIHIEDLSRQPLKEAIALEHQLVELECANFVAEEVSTKPVDRDLLLCSLSESMDSSTSHSPKSGAVTEAERGAPPTSSSDLQQLVVSCSTASRGTTRRQVIEKWVQQINVLNSCANTRGKGRGDMTMEVLEAAADFFVEGAGDHMGSMLRETLVKAVLGAFLDLRLYLHKASKEMLWIDPQLSNNSELTKCLTAWEEAWELGKNFLVLPDLRKAFCGISIEVASIQDFYPSFGKLMEDQDAELFLVLPRLVLLTGLFEPSHGSLPCSFWVERNEAWELLSQAFLELKLLYPGDQLDFWKLLVAKALEGPGLGHDGEFSKLLEKFLLQLEGLSVQLQRDDPKRWNRCCQLLLQSIATAMAVGTRVQSL